MRKYEQFLIVYFSGRTPDNQLQRQLRIFRGNYIKILLFISPLNGKVTTL